MLVADHLLFHMLGHGPEFVLLVAQLRFETGFAYGLLYAIGRKAVRCACRAHYVLFYHNRTKIVGTSMQAHLPYSFTHCQPGRLYVLHIGQHDTAHGYHAYIFFGSSKVAGTAYTLQQGIYILESPWNESHKTFGIFRFTGLHFTQFYQVLKT